MNPVARYRAKPQGGQTGLLRIGAVAAASGVSVQTLPFYEHRGLLAQPARLPSGYREYPDDVVRVVRFIKHDQDLGFTLEDITGPARAGRRRPGQL